MPAGSMDALGAFSYMTDNVPVWINCVTDLAVHTAAKHAEYTEAYKKHATTGKPRRRKNSSVCSIHTEDLFKKPNDPAPSAVAVDTTQGVENHGSARAQNQSGGNPRKRGTDEADPDFADAAFVSTRHNVIIHYDGHTQKILEDMVRNIVTARNNIRRGKMSQLPSMGFRSGMRCLPGRGPPDAVLSSIRSARDRGPPGPRNQTTFDLADKHLEVAHGLCESAAYQFLRAGDCKAELSSVEEKFRMLLEMATVEVQRLQKAKQQAPSEPEVEKEELELKLPPAPVLEPPSKPNASPTGTATGAIEVDDASSVSMEPIDLSAFRANRLNRMNRMAA